MKTQRNNRGSIVRVALVGYTNVGKSTLMNILSKSNVFAENKLFATLDTTVRKVVIEDIPFLLSDTVGFIRKLPTQLIESFKSTLDEIHEADLLLHIVDISHDCFENHINSVNLILKEIGCSDKKIVLVFNKIDAYVPEIIEKDDLVTNKTSKHYTIKEWEKTWMSRINGKAYFISALKKEKIDDLKKNIFKEIKKIHVTRYPFNNHFLN
tara:strand:- start:12 stop:641 length:630 start_codon:yes stop_codon:yes gene_type:complete